MTSHVCHSERGSTICDYLIVVEIEVILTNRITNVYAGVSLISTGRPTPHQAQHPHHVPRPRPGHELPGCRATPVGRERLPAYRRPVAVATKQTVAVLSERLSLRPVRGVQSLWQHAGWPLHRFVPRVRTGLKRP